MSVPFHLAIPVRVVTPVPMVARFFRTTLFFQAEGRKNRALFVLVSLIFLVFLGIGAGCTTLSTDKRLANLETRMDNQQFVDIRVASLEERTTALEHTVGEARAGQQRNVSGKTEKSQATQTPPHRDAPGTEALPQVVPATGQVTDATLAELREPLGKEPQAGASGFSHPSDLRQDVSGKPTVLALSVRREAIQKKTPLAPQSAPAGTVGAAYDAALALYDAGKHEASAKQFKAFVKQYPSSKFAPNALYWYGECFYSRGDFTTAILSFKDVVSRFPKHSKAAAALYKLGLSYRRLKDDENTRFYWQILVEDFPASAPAKLAKQQLPKLPPR